MSINKHAALSNLLHQVHQMKGMFDYDDGTIAEAIEDAEAALAEPRPVLIEAEDQPSNDERAEWAAVAVKEFCDITGGDLEEGFNDILVNLRHLADREGWDAPKAYDGSLRTYNEEISEQPKAFLGAE